MDVEQINNLLGSTEKQEVQYSDAQWLYIQDTQNGSYNNYIQYITTTLKQQFIDYHNAYLWVPFAAEILNTTASGPLTSRPPVIALRQSVLSLIGQLVVTTDQVSDALILIPAHLHQLQRLLLVAAVVVQHVLHVADLPRECLHLLAQLPELELTELLNVGVCHLRVRRSSTITIRR